MDLPFGLRSRIRPRHSIRDRNQYEPRLDQGVESLGRRGHWDATICREQRYRRRAVTKQRQKVPWSAELCQSSVGGGRGGGWGGVPTALTTSIAQFGRQQGARTRYSVGLRTDQYRGLAKEARMTLSQTQYKNNQKEQKIKPPTINNKKKTNTPIKKNIQ